MNNIFNIFKKLNTDIFNFFNEIFGKPEYKEIMVTASKAASPDHFYLHIIFIMILASIIIYRKKHNNAIARSLLISWISATSTMIIALLSLGVIIFTIKEYSHVTRPFCALKNINVILELIANSNCNASFPSGHTAFSTAMVTSFWPLFNKFFKFSSIIALITIAISRMAAGAHYPMDILGALVICLPLTIYIRSKMEHYIPKLKYFKND